jgi:hypothetical protein
LLYFAALLLEHLQVKPNDPCRCRRQVKTAAVSALGYKAAKWSVSCAVDNIYLNRPDHAHDPVTEVDPIVNHVDIRGRRLGKPVVSEASQTAVAVSDHRIPRVPLVSAGGQGGCSEIPRLRVQAHVLGRHPRRTYAPQQTSMRSHTFAVTSEAAMTHDTKRSPHFQI